LSHVIKEATGLSFQDLLSFIRVEESEKLLLGSNKKIGAIAEETGFSAVRYYIKHFETWFGMHPLEYRKQFTGKVSSREIKAVYTRSSPAEIEEAIRKQVKGVYSDYVDKQKAKPMIIEIDIFDDYVNKKDKSFALSTLMEAENMDVLSEPYDLLCSLDETLVASGRNYMITTGSKYPGSLDNLSILLYNFDGEIASAFSDCKRIADKAEIIKNDNEEIEFLIRCVGLSGDFHISRCKIPNSKFIADLEESIKANALSEKRSKLIKQWMSLPGIEFSQFSSSDTLSLRATLKGFSAELLLVDKI
jgi:hypothetical protein